MEITKPILHTGVLKHDIGNISYNQNFLEKLTDSKNVNVQLNSHTGEKITKVTNLEYKNGALYATMDVPEEYLADEIAFSADIIPSKYNKIDSNTFEPVEGVLDNVVFVNDGTKVRDTRTITRLQNLDDKGELNMAGEGENIAEKYGALKTKYATQETELANIRNDLEKANNEKETAQQTLQEKENEITELKKQLGVYKQSEETEKDEIIKNLVEKEDDPLVEAYKAMDIKYLRLLADKPASKSTPPKGVGTKTVEQKDGSEEEEEEDKFDYLARKKALGIR